MAHVGRVRVATMAAALAVGAFLTAGASGAPNTSALTTVAGTTLGFGGDGGPGTQAKLADPEGLAADARGLFIFDCANLRVRLLRPDGTITTFAGTGQAGFAGDGGPATSALLRPQCGANDPAGLALDRSGDLFIADTGNNRVRMVNPAGVITTVAGSGLQGFGGDGGPATAAQLAYPTGLAVDASGTLYIADSLNHRVRMVTPDGTITTLAGSGAHGCNLCSQGVVGPATAFALQDPVGLALAAAGDLLIADWITDRVYAVAPGGAISIVAGGPHAPTAATGFSGDGGPATAGELDGPAALALDARGNLYIADSLNQRVRIVAAADGTIDTFAGDGSQAYVEGKPANATSAGEPEGLAFNPQGRLFIAATAAHKVITVGAPATAPAAVTASQALPLPSNKTCTSRRAFPIRVRRLAGLTYSSAIVAVNGHNVPVYVYTTHRSRVRKIGPTALNRNRFRAFVDLRGLVRGRYAVRVTAVTTDGRVLTATRRYRTCSGRRLTGSIPRL
jgi:sugar lactone lactonase YvrE